MPSSLLNVFPKAPTDDSAEIRARTQKQASQKLEILAAVCGVIDCTDDLREKVTSDGTLTIDTRSIQDLLVNHSAPQRMASDELYLAFVFRYPGQQMQLFVNSPSKPHAIYVVSPTSKEFPVVTPSEWNDVTWSTVAIVFGGKLISDYGAVGAVLGEIKSNYEASGTRHVMISEALVKEVSGFTVFSLPQFEKHCLRRVSGPFERT
jgi:hypothetical protein